VLDPLAESYSSGDCRSGGGDEETRSRAGEVPREEATWAAATGSQAAADEALGSID
jgi:hypothetical protein